MLVILLSLGQLKVDIPSYSTTAKIVNNFKTCNRKNAFNEDFAYFETEIAYFASRG